MALEIFYSALHWAKKAERFATRAANSSQIAQTAAAQASQASGKIVQLGFDGAIEDGKLVFKHAPSGVEVPYELLDDYEYEVDLSYTGADLSSLTEMYVKNGPDTVTFVSALHRSSTEPATVGDMKAVMRYNSDTGYRWLFKAAYKITPAGKKVFLLYPVVASEEAINSKITNCITEIPQDIKLELVDGTMTLKAGSKVYVPNGFEADGVTPKFDVVVTESDADWHPSSTAGIRFGYYHFTANWISNSVTTHTYSGNTAKMNGITPQVYVYFYNTETNKIYNGSGGVWTEANISLPVCLFTNDANAKVTSIDQVFNGFGYIGSTTFALPNIKFLTPAGRNEDGTLKNVERVTQKVIINTYNYTTSGNQQWFISPDGNIRNATYYIQDTMPELKGACMWYCPVENKLYWCSSIAEGWKYITTITIAATNINTDSNFRVTSIDFRSPFRAVDQNDLRDVINTLTKHVVVTSLPSTLEEDTFYYIPE